MLQKTPLHQKHLDLNAKMTDFGGWDMPLQYDGILKEYGYCREQVAMFDTGHMGEIFFTGDLEKSGANLVTTVDVLKLPVGKCKYGFILNNRGGIEDDVIVYKLDDDTLMFVVNACTAEDDFVMIDSQLFEGELDNVSDQIAKLDIQGPMAKEKLMPFFEEVIGDLKFFSFVNTKLFGKKCILSRTGYTGELGYEVYCSSESVQKLWDALLESDVKPAGLGARDVLRLEMGYSLYGNDLDNKTTPLEANLKMFLEMGKDFTGRAALEKQMESGVEKILLPFKSTSRRAPRPGQKIMLDGKEIGVVTSGVFSPKLEVGIGLGYCEKTLAVGSEIIIDDGRSGIQAHIATLPFYTGGSLKNG